MAVKLKAQANNKKNEIIDAAAALFEKVGYHGTTMQMVADGVGLGKPTLYHYFHSKSEILFAIHQEFVSKLLGNHAAREARNLPPDALLRGICKDIVGFIDSHPGYVRAFFDHFDELDEVSKLEIRKQRARYLKLTCDVISSGTKAGVFVKCEPRTTALAFLGMCNWTYKWFPRETDRDVEKLTDAMCKIFLNGLMK